MARFLVLIRLEIKRSVKLLPKLMAGTVLLIIIVLAIAAGAGNILGEKEEKGGTLLDVGVICHDDSRLMDMAKAMIKSMRSVSSTVNLEFVDEDIAMEGLDSGRYMAVIVVPDNAIKDIMSGKNADIELKFPKNAGFEAAAVKEITDSAVRMLAAAQGGIYSAYDFYGKHNKGYYKSEAAERLNESYIKAVLLREGFFDNNTVIATGELGIMQYYIISGLVLFMFLFGMNSLTYMEDYKRDITKRLEQSGVGIGRQIIARFTGVLSLYGIIGIGLGLGLCAGGGFGAQKTISLLLSLIPVLAAAASFVLFIQALIKHKPARVLFMFLFAVFQAFVTGGFIPSLMLPEAIDRIGCFTPAYYMTRELKLIYLDSSGIWGNTAILIGITAVFLLLADIVTKARCDVIAAS